ncbi:MAG: hypothetical protein AAF368_03960 [Planctomycetota bacterium]
MHEGGRLSPTRERADQATPERLLVLGIVTQAVADLFAYSVNGEPDAKRGKTARLEALKFLTDEYGPWAASREFICGHLEGVDADLLRLRVVAILDGRASFSAPWDTKGRGVPKARALWAAQAGEAEAERARRDLERARVEALRTEEERLEKLRAEVLAELNDKDEYSVRVVALAMREHPIL